MPRPTPRFWQSRSDWRARALWPLSRLFGAVASMRRFLYRVGWLRVVRLEVPVVVVGNIAVGGSGKTPVVQWLVERLRARGYTPGVVSRGYGRASGAVVLVTADAAAEQVGDEPLLLARSVACPVAVGADRVAAGRALLAAHPECNVIVADDGMQHYRLHRDVEVAVVDQRVIGNALLLPAGPLREPLGRLASVDLVVAHGALDAATRRAAGAVPMTEMVLAGQVLRPVGRGAATPPLALSDLAGLRVHAVAGIGRPERFFAQLAAQGLRVIPHPFPDHHVFRVEDLCFDSPDPLIMTSKDAVKCASFALTNAWELPVEACIADTAADRIVEKLLHGHQAA
nr:tetraacyldisaccharide 4'-kinase [Zoogloeaceae bacterium]